MKEKIFPQKQEKFAKMAIFYIKGGQLEEILFKNKINIFVVLVRFFMHQFNNQKTQIIYELDLLVTTLR